MSTLAFYAQFVKSLVGVNSLTVTWDIEQITRSDGTRSALVTGGATSITIGRRGLYGYLLAAADTKLYDYVATAITAGDVDQKEIAALWTMYEADGLKLAGQTITAAAGVTFPASVASPTNITAGTINSVSGSVTLADDGITAAKLADSAIAEIAAAATGLSASQIGDAVLDEVYEDAETLRQLLRLIRATLAGKSDGGESTTNHFRDIADTKNRITATVDAAGNRTAVTVDVT